MSNYHFEPLNPTDYNFLVTETPDLHMHVAGIMVFDAGPLKKRGGGVDFERIKNAFACALHLIPRYRQKLLWLQSERKSGILDRVTWQEDDTSTIPVWVDDPQFNLDYHVRHTSLPKPGSDDQLKTLVARIADVELDRSRPLWEIWVVEGLTKGRFAIVSKMHHCMVDGVSGVDLSNIIMSDKPDYVPEDPPPYVPRPAPTQKELRLELLKDRVMIPWKMVEGISDLWSNSDSFSDELVHGVKAVGEAVSLNLGLKKTPSPLNGINSPHRVIEWIDTPLDYVKSIRHALGCTINDVVLTIATSALRDVLQQQGFDVNNDVFRVLIPVSIWQDRDEGQIGNQIILWTLELPIHEGDPVEQLRKLRHMTDELKHSQQADGIKIMSSVLKYTPALIPIGTRAVAAGINSYVTNVPGPQFPVYQLGAEMVRAYPVVPLLEDMGIALGVMSYNGVMCWGLTADLSIVPNPKVLSKAIEDAVVKVGACAGLGKPEKVT